MAMVFMRLMLAMTRIVDQSDPNGRHPRRLPPAPLLRRIAISMTETARRPRAGNAAGGRDAAAPSQGTRVPGFFVPADRRGEDAGRGEEAR